MVILSFLCALCVCFLEFFRWPFLSSYDMIRFLVSHQGRVSAGQFGDHVGLDDVRRDTSQTGSTIVDPDRTLNKSSLFHYIILNVV